MREGRIHTLAGTNRVLVEFSPDVELERFSFPEAAPELGVVYRYAPEADVRTLRIRVGSGPASYNGVPVQAFSGTVSVGAPGKWGYVEIRQFAVTRPEGAAAGEITVDPGNDALRFQMRSGASGYFTCR